MGVLFWHFLAPSRPEADPYRKRIADKAIVKLTEDLRRHRGEIKDVAVMHFFNDGSDYVTLKLRERLAVTGVFEVEDADLMEKVRYMLKLRNRGSFDTREVIKYGKWMGVQAVIAGKLERFESVKKEGVITGTVRMIEIPGGKVLAEIPIRASSSSDLMKETEEPGTAGSAGKSLISTPWHIRFLIYVLAVLLLPVLTISFIRYMVAKRSNGHNAFVLSIYTAVDLILAYFVAGGFVDGTSVVIFIGASLAAFIYNLSIMSFALKLES